jgi:PAS domain S-box-containing protein
MIVSRPQLYANGIFESLRAPLVILDADLQIKIASAAFYSLFKVTPEETTGRLIHEIGNGQWNSPALRASLGRVIPENANFDDSLIEHDFQHIGPRSMLLSGRQLRDGEGTPPLILLMMEDVSERYRAEVLIAQQQQWFKVTLSSIGDSVIATDANAHITFMNPPSEVMTGWAAEQAIGRPLAAVFNIVNEENRQVVESPVTKAIRRGAIVGLANHTILIARDGTERSIDDSAAPIYDDRGKIVGVVMVFHDITERRKIERLIESSEIRYRRLFETAHDGILILDATTGKITDVNRFLLDLLNEPLSYFVGKELWQIGVYRDIEENKSAMTKLLQSGSIRYEDLPLPSHDGRHIPVEFVSNVYMEHDKKVIQCNIRDISARKRFEREREALLANEKSLRLESEAANRSKDVFLATLSHEMRTPLNAILGWASVIRRSDCSPQEIQEGIVVIERNVRAQAQLIDDVLDVSRIVSGKLQLEIAPAELSTLIKDAVDVVRPSADAAGIQFQVEIDPVASHVSCDAHRSRQVIWNLLTNAVKFTQKGGTITIKLSRDRSTARIQIGDNGQGIPADLLPYVFDRFRQGEGGTKRKYGGLGLGLSLVKTLVELHGGTVSARSDGLGKGSLFTVHLPLRAVRLDLSATGQHDDGVPPIESILPRLDGLRILMVDDEADARDLLAKVLRDAGAIVAAVGSVVEALQVIETVQPQVLLSDIAMTAQDGYDFIRLVRKSGRSAKDLPAIALTAFAHKEDIRRVLLSGFQMHVAKPVDPYDLIAVVASLAGRIDTPT